MHANKLCECFLSSFFLNLYTMEDRRSLDGNSLDVIICSILSYTASNLYKEKCQDRRDTRSLSEESFYDKTYGEYGVTVNILQENKFVFPFFSFLKTLEINCFYSSRSH